MFDVDGSCIDCAIMTIDDEVAQHACAMAVTHLIAEAIKDPTLGMPALRHTAMNLCACGNPLRSWMPAGSPCPACAHKRADAPPSVDAFNRRVIMVDVQCGCGWTGQAQEGEASSLMAQHMMNDACVNEPEDGCSLCGVSSNYAKSDTRGRCYECSVKP